MIGSVERVGANVSAAIRQIGAMAEFSAKSLGACVRPLAVRLIVNQAVSLGVRAMPLALATSLFVGMVIVLQSGYELSAFNANSYVPGAAGKALTRIMIPIFTALVIGARTSASIAAELGTMRVSEQIDAMQIMGVRPQSYLVVPRVMAAALMLPLITVYADAIGLAGGMLIGKLGLHISPQLYWRTTFDYLKLSDVLTGLAKTVFFGAAMGICGCFFGFNASGGAEGVGKATTRAVVFTMLTLILLEYLLSTWTIYVMETLFPVNVGG